MIQEIERKFLIKDHSWREQLSEKHPMMHISHCYLVNKPEVTIRLQYRYRPHLDERKAAINIKSPREGISRKEIELPFDPEEAIKIFRELRKTHLVIDKVRSFIDIDDELYWEIDEFLTESLKGLILAEVEIPSEDFELALPEWVGEEVTENREYYNAYLAAHMEIPE